MIRTRLARSIGVVTTLALVGCNAIAGIDSPELVSCAGSGGDCQATGSGGSGAGTGGAGNGGATSSTTSMMSSSASGPPAPVCGDGKVDSAEQCDDGNTTSGDGCTSDCKVECSGIGLALDPMTFHCYRIIGIQLDWESAKGSCGQFHEHLATITSQEELTFLAPKLPGHWWLDGVRHGNGFEWDDGEPWGFTAWKPPGMPPMDPKKSCVKLDGGNFDTDDCKTKMGYVCELDPAGR